MTTKNSSIKNSRLYAILSPQDAARIGLTLEEAAREAVLGGADIVQLRDKASSGAELIHNAKRVAAAVHAAGGIFIVNDSPEAAAQSGADGVHVGQDDTSIAAARKSVGAEKIVGCSTHSLEQALKAQEDGADYIGYGPIFSTPTKPDYRAVGPDSVPAVAAQITIPFFTIGGIDGSNIEAVAKRGARRVAVVRAAFGSKDVRASVRRLKEKLEHAQ